jgi:hypothetical protein
MPYSAYARLAFVPLLVATHVRRSSRQSVRDSLSCIGECLPRPFDTSGIIRGLTKKLSNGKISATQAAATTIQAARTTSPFHHSRRARMAPHDGIHSLAADGGAVDNCAQLPRTSTFAAPGGTCSTQRIRADNKVVFAKDLIRHGYSGAPRNRNVPDRDLRN